MKRNRVELTRPALKNLRSLPEHVIANFQAWVNIVNLSGIIYARTIKGYHDEALKGNRAGQRSIRLSRAYRAIYVEYDVSEKNIGAIEILSIIEVREINKHEY